VVRALKDADICTSITTSQLDLLLTKIHVAAAKGAPVQVTVASTCHYLYHGKAVARFLLSRHHLWNRFVGQRYCYS
jgi:hypothetical protein